MAVTRRGVSNYSSVSASTSHAVPLPSGSQVNDLVFLATTNPAWGTSFTVTGSTVIYDAGVTVGVMRYGAFKKRLTSADITAGVLTVGLSTSQHMAAVCVGYSSAGDFGTPGSMFQKDGTVTTTTVTAPALSVSNGSNDILTVALIRHSGTTQSLIGVTPTTTNLGTALVQGSGVPSTYVGVYTGTPADRTITWSFSHANAVGFQIPVTEVAPVTGFEWNTLSPTVTGATLVGAMNTVDHGTHTSVVFSQGSGLSSMSWATSSLPKYTVRFYLETPATAWSDTAAAIFHAMSGATLLPGTDLAGSFNPGQFRFKLSTNTEAARSGNILSLNSIYRVEIQVDTVAGTFWGALYELGSDTPLYNTGLMAVSVGGSANAFAFGRIKEMTSLQNFGISRVKVINTVGSWIGRHDSSDPFIEEETPEFLGVWNGESIDEIEILGVWNGTSIDTVEIITIK